MSKDLADQEKASNGPRLYYIIGKDIVFYEMF